MSITRPAQLAQVNLARLRFQADSPRLVDFLAGVERINRLAERSPGFVWRLRTAEGHLNGAELIGDPLAVINLSVWESYPALHSYIYRSQHGHYLRRRAEWFDRLTAPTIALWWVAPGHHPTAAEAIARLSYLRANGPTPRSFTVRCRFTPTGQRDTISLPLHEARTLRHPNAAMG
ncbi:MAG TPA: DUF3291 domain-containing protein [Mycobacteriales bacterium]|nr:DUF3291 domain-containing protein [Mycobacteriales bacterium]